MPDLPPVADGVERPLDPRYVPHQRLVGWITALILSGGSFVALLVAVLAGGMPAWMRLAALPLWVAFSLALAWHAYGWPVIEYRHASYRVDDLGLEIRRGVIWRTVTTIPRSRVQHTDVSQGPIERSYGLGTLVVYTAGTEFARVELPGLDHATALRIRAHLQPPGEGDAV